MYRAYGIHYIIIIQKFCMDKNFKICDWISENRLPRTMNPIHYSFGPLILFHVPYTFDLLQYDLSIAIGAGV